MLWANDLGPMSCIYVSQYLYASMHPISITSCSNLRAGLYVCLPKCTHVMYLCIYVSMYLCTRYRCITLQFLDNAFPARAISILFPCLHAGYPAPSTAPSTSDILCQDTPSVSSMGLPQHQQICCVGNTTSVCLTCGKGQRPGESFKAIFEQRAVQFWPPQVTIVGSLGNPGSLCKKFNLCRNWNPNLWSQAVSSRDIALTLSLSAPTQCLTSALLSRPPTLDHQVNTSSVACRALKKFS